MTCVIGLESKGVVYMGADSRMVSGWEGRTTAMSKMFRKMDFLVGICGFPRMLQLLQYKLEVEPQDDGNDEKHMVCVFAEAVRKCFKEGGFAKVENNEETGGQFLVGYHGKLYEIEGNFQINRVVDGYEAIGSGREYAIGAMRVLGKMPAEKRILKALETSAYFNIGVAPPFQVMKV